MTDSSSPDDKLAQELVPAPVDGSAGAAEAQPASDRGPEPPDPDSELDAHGFDPAAYRWIPVLRKPRRDGWTPERQLDFIRALADTCIVERAAEAAGMSVKSCYRLRNSPEGAAFAAAWDSALAYAAHRLVDIAFERAINGTDEPVFDKEGHRIGRRMRQNDRLMMFLLRSYLPDRFRFGGREQRAADEPPPPVELPLDEAMARLLPVEPPEPHRLMPPDALESALQCADILDGGIPHWHRGRGDAEEVETQGLGPAFERQLENAKREAAGLPPLGEDEDPEGGDDALLA